MAENLTKLFVIAVTFADATLRGAPAAWIDEVWDATRSWHARYGLGRDR